MKRKKNTLYFEPFEKKKFFRAIQLDCIFNEGGDYKKDIEHEKAHIEAIVRLGYENKIVNYQITKTKKWTEYSVSHYKLSPTDQFEVSLAPKEPSEDDYITVLSFIQLHKAIKELEKEKNFSCSNLKQKIINQKEIYVK